MGRTVAPFHLRDVSGGPFRSPWAAHRATVVLFFASWCTECHVELPSLTRLLRERPSTRVSVVGIDADVSDQVASAFARREGVAFPVALDPHERIAPGVFGFAGYPDAVLVSGRGVIVAVRQGPLSAGTLRRWLGT